MGIPEQKQPDMHSSSRTRAAWSRVLPYLIYLAFLALESAIATFGEHAFDVRWVYPIKVGLVALALVWLWPRYEELQRLPDRRQILLACIVGIGVWGLWITLDHGWMMLGESDGFDPRTPEGNVIAVLVAFRIMGAALVVPLMEELFWRSFVMRWIVRQDFLAVSPSAVTFGAFVVTAAFFGLQHHQWLAGIIAGVAYGLLYVRTQNLWVPVIAHAVTNGVLGFWVLASGQWRFW